MKSLKKIYFKIFLIILPSFLLYDFHYKAGFKNPWQLFGRAWQSNYWENDSEYLSFFFPNRYPQDTNYKHTKSYTFQPSPNDETQLILQKIKNDFYLQTMNGDKTFYHNNSTLFKYYNKIWVEVKYDVLTDNIYKVQSHNEIKNKFFKRKIFITPIYSIIIWVLWVFLYGTYILYNCYQKGDNYINLLIIFFSMCAVIFQVIWETLESYISPNENVKIKLNYILNQNFHNYFCSIIFPLVLFLLYKFTSNGFLIYVLSYIFLFLTFLPNFSVDVHFFWALISVQSLHWLSYSFTNNIYLSIFMNLFTVIWAYSFFFFGKDNFSQENTYRIMITTQNFFLLPYVFLNLFVFNRVNT